MVMHLVTAADGAAQFYTTENNQARYENEEQAVDIDGKLQNAYNGHPCHKIIRNVPLKDFQYKIDTVIEELMKCIEFTDAESNVSHFKYLLKDHSRPDSPRFRSPETHFSRESGGRRDRIETTQRRETGNYPQTANQASEVLGHRLLPFVFHPEQGDQHQEIPPNEEDIGHEVPGIH